MSLRQGSDLGVQVFQVAVDQARIARDAAPEIIGDQPFRLPFEQRHAEDVLDLAQHLGRAGLRDGDFLGRLVQRAMVL